MNFKDIFTVSSGVSKKPRNELLDFLRGGAMLLVLWQHASAPGSNIVLLFHMPLLFILSGYTEFLLGAAEKKTFSAYVCNRFKRLIIPYFAFEIINYILWVSGCIIKSKPIPTVGAWINILCCLNTDLYTGFMRLWFLPCMFVCSCAFWLLLKVSKKNKLCLTVFAIALFVLSWCVSRFVPFRLPMTVDIALMALPFLIIGYIFGGILAKLLASKNIPIDIVTVICCYVILIFSNIHGAEMSMYNSKYGNYIFSITAVLTGSVIFLIVVKYIYWLFKKLTVLKNFVLWFGYNSLATFPIHLEIKCVLTMLGLPLINKWPILLLSMLIFNIPIVNIIANFFPFLLGNMGKKSSEVRK